MPESHSTIAMKTNTVHISPAQNTVGQLWALQSQRSLATPSERGYVFQTLLGLLAMVYSLSKTEDQQSLIVKLRMALAQYSTFTPEQKDE
jgi:hypothetical protein